MERRDYFSSIYYKFSKHLLHLLPSAIPSDYQTVANNFRWSRWEQMF
jgi:hypothetical protein